MENKLLLKKAKRTLFYIVILGVVLTWAFPILWVILNSFKKDSLIISQSITLFFKPTLEHYQRIFSTHNFSDFLRNSLFVACTSTVIVLAASFTAAYSVSRFDTGKGIFTLSVLITRIAPPAAVLMPFFIIFKHMSLLNNLMALVIINISLNMSFGLLMLKTFIDEIPTSIDEAAFLEGANWHQTLFRLIFPLARSGIITTAIFTFIFSWNEYLFAMVLCSSNRVKTLPVAAGDFITAYAVEWGPVFSSGTLILLPILIMVFMVQKYIVKGLTFGATK